MHDVQSLIGQSPPVDVTKPYDADGGLAGKVMVVTGGASGLGAHMVRRWASHGAHVFVGDVDDAAGEALVAALRHSHPRQTFAYARCDVVDWDQQVALFDTARRMSPSGAIDVVVPNAGVLVPADASAFENPELDEAGRLARPNTRTLDVNITGVLYTTNLALHHLAGPPRTAAGDVPETEGKTEARAAAGTILLIGSLASLMPLPGQSLYTISKHAVMGLFRSLRASAFRRGVRVNMLAPYYVAQTNMLRAPVEAVLMGGSAGAARIDDVLDAATRLVADPTISGRALVVGPRLKTTETPRTGQRGGDGDLVLPPVEAHEGDGEGRAVWECYADDYNQVESFRWRYIHILNAVEAARGYLGWAADVLRIFWRKRQE